MCTCFAKSRSITSALFQQCLFSVILVLTVEKKFPIIQLNSVLHDREEDSDRDFALFTSFDDVNHFDIRNYRQEGHIIPPRECFILLKRRRRQQGLHVFPLLLN